MKTILSCLTPRLRALLLAFATAGASGCATTNETGGAADYPDPVEKQIRIQEEMSRVTRSFL